MPSSNVAKTAVGGYPTSPTTPPITMPTPPNQIAPHSDHLTGTGCTPCPVRKIRRLSLLDPTIWVACSMVRSDPFCCTKGTFGTQNTTSGALAPRRARLDDR